MIHSHINSVNLGITRAATNDFLHNLSLLIFVSIYIIVTLTPFTFSSSLIKHVWIQHSATWLAVVLKLCTVISTVETGTSSYVSYCKMTSLSAHEAQEIWRSASYLQCLTNLSKPSNRSVFEWAVCILSYILHFEFSSSPTCDQRPRSLTG